MNANWNKEQWERFQYVDIMHDMTDGGSLTNVNENKLLKKCLNELGYEKYQNVTPTSKKIYEDTDSIKFDSHTPHPKVNFSRNKFTKDELYKMRDLLDFAVIKYFFIDAAHTPGKTSYSGDPIPIKYSDLGKKYSSYFDYSIINDQKLAEVSHKATTANVCDPATTNVFNDQIIDKNGSKIIYSKNKTLEDNTKYYGFPYGSMVQTKIIENDETGLPYGCYVYVQYNNEGKNENYKFSAFYRIDFIIEADRKKFVKTPYVTYKRVDYSDYLKQEFGLDHRPEKCQEIGKCPDDKIKLSNLEKASYFDNAEHKNRDSDNPDDVKYIKQGIEYIVLKAYGDRNQSSFLKEINEDSKNKYNSSNTCILSTDSHLVQAAAHTSDIKNYRIQCVYKHNAEGAIIVDSVINKDTEKSITSYIDIIKTKCQTIQSFKPNIKVDFAQNVGSAPMSMTADLLIKNNSIPYATIKINLQYFDFKNSDRWNQVKNYLAKFFNILIVYNNNLVKDVIKKITESEYYRNVIMATSTLDNEYLKLLQKFNDFIDALLSLIIEKQLSKYMKDNNNLFTLFPLIYNFQYGSLRGKRNEITLTSSLIDDEASRYFQLISDNEMFQDSIANTNSLYILKLLYNFIPGDDFLANFLDNIDFNYDSIRPEYEWFTKFENEFPTGYADSDDDNDDDDHGSISGGIQKGGGALEEKIYDILYNNNDDIYFLKFLYLLNLDYSTIKNNTIISSILSNNILIEKVAATAAAAKAAEEAKAAEVAAMKEAVAAKAAEEEGEEEEGDEEEEMNKMVIDDEQKTRPTSPPTTPRKRLKIATGLTKKKRNKKIQTLKKKLKKQIKQLKENFKKQVKKFKLIPRKYIRTPKKKKLLTTFKRRKNKKDKKDKK